MRSAPAPIDPSDPAALASWLAETTALAAAVHDLAVDATARRGQRKHARGFLRASMSRGFRRLSLALAQLDPARPADGAP